MKPIIYLPLAFAFLSIVGWQSSNLQHTAPVLPKNIILMIGDGMGLAQISASLYHQGNSTILEQFPVTGLQKTSSADNLVTDSAAAATAMACGEKTFNNAVGLDSIGNPCKTLLDEAAERGLSTGIVVTSSIVHATPAAFLAHANARYYYDEIAEGIVKSKLDFFIGGGRQYFFKRDKDNRNLLNELKDQGFSIYDFTHSELGMISPSPAKRFGFFTADNQPPPTAQGRDYLPFAAKMAVKYLPKRSSEGFFLMVEGSQIDWACHANKAVPLLDEMKDFETAIARVLEFARKDGETLVIVTGDHETGGASIVEGSTMRKIKMGFTSNGHTGAMAPVFAFGPGAELFRGIYENNEIHDKIKEALNWF